MTLKIPLAFLGRSLINDFRVTEFNGRNVMTDSEVQRDQVSQDQWSHRTPAANLPLWKSHKVVQAWPIRAWYAEPPTRGEGNLIIYLEDGPDGQTYPALIESRTMFSRYQPVPGDYFVIYDDGYKSISPKKAFEEGYMRLDAAVNQTQFQGQCPVQEA